MLVSRCNDVVAELVGLGGDSLMGLIADLLKDIPLSAVLREKIVAIEGKQAALETENAILKDDKRELQARIVKLEGQVENLKQEIENLAHVDDSLTQTDILLLKALTSPGVHSAGDLGGIVHLNLNRVEYHLRRLAEAKYVYYASGRDRLYYSLTQEGREYLIKRNLI